MNIQKAMNVIMKGRTSFVIAHRLSTISLAERVVLVENGRIVADGTHLELLASEPRYAEVLAAADDTDDAAQPTGGPSW